MPTYAIGDVQGCYAELMQLLELIKFDSSRDQLWFVGDLVNRGPQSLEVLRLVKNLGDKHITVLGNHDLHLLAVAHGCQKYHKDDTFVDVLKAKDSTELLSWLRCRPFLHYDKKLNFIMSHAGISPQWDLTKAQQCANEVERVLCSDDYLQLLQQMYGGQPDLWNDNLSGWDRYRYIVNAFTRMRYCDKDYRLDLIEKGPLGTQPKNLIPWYKLLNPQYKDTRIVFGHWAALMGKIDESNVAQNIFAIDTGCFWGRQLTALQLETLQSFQVDAQN